MWKNSGTSASNYLFNNWYFYKDSYNKSSSYIEQYSIGIIETSGAPDLFHDIFG